MTAGEGSLSGAIRELEKETGLVANRQDLLLIGSLKKNNYFLDSYTWKSPEQLKLTDLNLQMDEVYSAQFINLTEWERMNNIQLVVPVLWDRYNLYGSEVGEWIKLES
ncbi:hypothetical protein BBH88_12670 [Planococcus antarcticus DSM 14505]|uniref:Nudix hydrolase domain-containing protein n=1 Tax=Planococcus antarcticus DSM 14505 TaxID=1185653 RepID=A0ABN4RMZ3_9BACL|nr:hypothetical protein BBH88_12670 [Planococcus antarcticus DSM 14505]